MHGRAPDYSRNTAVIERPAPIISSLATNRGRAASSASSPLSYSCMKHSARFMLSTARRSPPVPTRVGRKRYHRYPWSVDPGLARIAPRRNRPARAYAETERRHTMNILLWVLQVLAALMYAASGVMKVFMFDKVSVDVQSFGALPRQA